MFCSLQFASPQLVLIFRYRTSPVTSNDVLGPTSLRLFQSLLPFAKKMSSLFDQVCAFFEVHGVHIVLSLQIYLVTVANFFFSFFRDGKMVWQKLV